MSDILSRSRVAVWAVLALAAVLLVTAGFQATAQPATESEEPTDEPTSLFDDPTEEPTDEPTEEPTDEPTEEPTDEPTVQPSSSPSSSSETDPVAQLGIQQLLRTGSVDADALYDAFLQYLIEEYDSDVVVEDDTLSIQFDLQDLEPPSPTN